MTKEEKLEEIVKYIESLGLKYTRPKSPEMHTCHLFVCRYKIAFHVCGEHDEEFRVKYKKRKIFIYDDSEIDGLKQVIDRIIEGMNYSYEHRFEIAEKKRKNRQYHLECLARHEERVKRREAHERSVAAKKLEKQEPKKKRQRIVNVEKV